MREKELAPVLEEYRGLDESQRKMTLEDPSTAAPPKRPVPDPPKNGLIIKGYCAYLQRDRFDKLSRAVTYYYKNNPDRWAVETQSDMLWLTEDEWRSLIPPLPKPGAGEGRGEGRPGSDVTAQAKPGDQLPEITVPAPIQTRFFSTIGIDYMEGSVNALPPRHTTMTITVTKVTPAALEMRLDGYGHMGKPPGSDTDTAERTRGCEVRITGQLRYDRKTDRFTRFDLAGVGRAWGNKMNYTRREMGVGKNTWLYGIACELVDGDSPMDRIPPYNLLHYNGVGPYFGGK